MGSPADPPARAPSAASSPNRRNRTLGPRDLIPLVLLLTLAACAGDAPASPTATGLCDAAAAGRLVGQAAPTEAEVRRLTGSEVVRRIAPGQPVTQDFSEGRVTVVTDPATGRVVRAGCG